MARLTLRDLQSRKRQFAIATIGAALVFAMALVISGLSGGFRAEARNTVAAVGADVFLVPRGVAGPFSTTAGIPVEWVEDVVRVTGVQKAEPLVFSQQAIIRGSSTVNILLVGFRPGRLGTPPVAQGRAPRAAGEAAVDERGAVDVGATINVAGRRFRVVGLTHGLTANAGVPDVFIPLSDAEAMLFGGRALATTIVVKGAMAFVPAPLSAISPATARDDLLRPLHKGIAAIDNLQVFLWIVAALIIGVVVYLSALERVGDFAVLKALGTSSRALFGSLVIEAVAIAIVAAALSAICARLLVPLFPIPVAIPRRAFLLLPAIALGVGIAASVGGLHRAVATEPALAFGTG